MILPKSAKYVTAENFAIFDLKRAYHSQFGEVNRPQHPYFCRIRKKTLFPSVFLIKMADEEGFEPPIRVTPYTRFRVARIQPLCHSSIYVINFKIIFVCKSFFLRATQTLSAALNWLALSECGADLRLRSDSSLSATHPQPYNPNAGHAKIFFLIKGKRTFLQELFSFF